MEFLANIPALLALVLGLVFLVGGGELLVRGAAALALKANIPPLLIGLTVVSMGTSAPELFASVEAALEGHPGLAVGNVLGSNVANLALILGLTALIRPSPWTAWPFASTSPSMGASLLFVAVASDLEMTQTEGIGALMLMGCSSPPSFGGRNSRTFQTTQSWRMQPGGHHSLCWSSSA